MSLPHLIADVNVPAKDEILIRVADITIALSTADASIRLALEEPMSRFLADGTEPDVRVNAVWRDQPWDPCGEKIFDSGGVWQLYFDNDAYCFTCSSPAVGALPYKIASFNRHFSEGVVHLYREYFKSGDPINPLEYPLDELLMVNLLSLGKGVEVHACGLMTAAGDGYLFPGISGAGKTTMARLWEDVPGAVILSDDRIILRHLEGKFWMYGTPWHGEAELAAPVRVPLREILFLRRGSRNEVASLCQGEAAACLFPSTFPTFYSAAGLEFTLAFLEAVAGAIPCHDFFVVPDHHVIDFIEARKGLN
jgi:hypothetical protein